MIVKSRKPTVSLVKFKSNKHVNNRVESQKTHFFNRFYERVGWKLTEAGYTDLLKIMQSDENSKFLHKNEENGSVYSVRYQGLTLRLVYDIFTQSLITVLPR
jgi:hypothetical protein